MMKLDDIVSINLRSQRDDMEFAVYRISEMRTDGSESIMTQPHRINFDAIIFIQQGTGRHHIDYKSYNYQPGTIISIARYQVHYFDDNPELEGYAILFNDHVFSCGSDDLVQDKIRFAMETINCIDVITSDCQPYIDKLYQEAQKSGFISREVIRALVRALLLDNLVQHNETLAHHKNQDSRHFRRLKGALENHFHQTHKVADYAKMIGVCSKSLNLIAKKHTGKTAKQLIDDRVILELKRKLAFSQHSIQDISLQLGFKEATNMTKFFRRHTDVTPKEFRQLCHCSLARKNNLLL
ncbi:helix-turn-helix domain-containing protein [Thaumasiovibrio sp. DFM-14]|uniref:helix-turn-helix domain-containing protein n=1 Tax=Thaumasiovibrio sp. DFM-14 TaxID=3384792 RepID=UPI0039A1F949